MQKKRPRVVNQDGLNVREVLSILSAEISDENSLQAIKGLAAQIVERAVDPKAEAPKNVIDGLLYGLIQSGKTSVITAAAAMAADNQFDCILILTSDNNLLYDQTLERIRRGLRGLTILGKNDWREQNRFKALIQNPPFVVVCSKNANKLQSLLEAFKISKSKQLATLIIDDEADQASLNTQTSKLSGRVSAINEAITNFRDYFPVNTYLQVTATPQALFLQRPDNRYRPAFTLLSEPGPGYVGGDQFFGPNARILRDVKLSEVDQLRTTNQPSPGGNVPPGLKSALITFLVAAGARLVEDAGGGYSFLCHVSVNTKDHKYIVNLIEKFKSDGLTALRAGQGAQYTSLVKELQEAYADLASTEKNLPDFNAILPKIEFYLPGASVKLINAGSGEEIRADSALNIFVGGTKLGRGVTLSNLLVSYYGRNPKKPNSDTVLQHARMYGYRQKDLGLTRLFLPPELAEHFKLIHQLESGLRQIVMDHPEGKFEGIYVSNPLQATRRNVLDPASLGLYLASSTQNPKYPLRTPKSLIATRAIDEKLARFDDKGNGVEVDIPFICDLIDMCETDPNSPNLLWDKKTLRSALEELSTIKGSKAYIVVRTGRGLNLPRREGQGILTGGEDSLAPRDAPTLFMYRMNSNAKGEEECWWPHLRFANGNYAIAFSFDR